MSQVWKILKPIRILPYPEWETPDWWTEEDYDWDEDKLILKTSLV